MKRLILLEVLAMLIIMLFLYASISKLLSFHRFIGEMNNQPLPNSWTPFLVWAIPLLEIGISASLMWESTRLVGFYAAAVLMSLFTIYTAIILLHFFSYIPCSCGGVIERLTWKQHLLLNIFYLGIAMAGIVLQRRVIKDRNGKNMVKLFTNNGLA